MLTRRDTLYRSQPQNRAQSAAHRADFLIDLLKGEVVSDIFEKKEKSCILFSQNMTLTQMLPIITSSKQSCFPVINKESQLLGVFSINDVRAILAEAELMGDLITASDVMKCEKKVLLEDEELNSALIKFSSHKINELPVIDAENKVLGLISEHEVIEAYQVKLEELKKSEENA